MLNITLTIIAAPELLNSLNKMAEAFGESRSNLLQKTTPVPTLQSQVKSTIAIPTITPQPAQMQPPQKPIAPRQVPPIAPPTPGGIIPTTQQTYTLDQLALAGTQLVDSGHMQELRNLLTEFGVQALTMLPKEQYGAFATRLRALGARI